MPPPTYNSLVAARTRVAKHILADAALLKQLQDAGGLERDLVAVVVSGEAAAAANMGQSIATGVAAGASVDVEGAFVALQREYSTIMARVVAVRADLADDGARGEVLKPIDAIIANETAVHIKTKKGEGDRAIRKAMKSASQEAVRAEIEKDATALLANGDVAGPLLARGVDAGRLKRLEQDAQALSGKLAARTAKRGQRRAATAAEHASVTQQRRKWGAIYRILTAVHDEQVEALLKEAARRR